MTGFAVAHLLNCLFASCSVASPHLSDEINSNQNDSKKKKKKGKKADKPKPFEPNPAAIGWQRMTNEWMQVTPDSIWKDIEKRAKSYFRTNIECKSIDQACSLYNIQKVAKRATAIMNHLLLGEFVARRVSEKRHSTAPTRL